MLTKKCRYDIICVRWCAWAWWFCTHIMCGFLGKQREFSCLFTLAKCGVVRVKGTWSCCASTWCAIQWRRRWQSVGRSTNRQLFLGTLKWKAFSHSCANNHREWVSYCSANRADVYDIRFVPFWFYNFQSECGWWLQCQWLQCFTICSTLLLPNQGCRIKIFPEGAELRRGRGRTRA